LTVRGDSAQQESACFSRIVKDLTLFCKNSPCERDPNSRSFFIPVRRVWTDYHVIVLKDIRDHVFLLEIFSRLFSKWSVSSSRVRHDSCLPVRCCLSYLENVRFFESRTRSTAFANPERHDHKSPVHVHVVRNSSETKSSLLWKMSAEIALPVKIEFVCVPDDIQYNIHMGSKKHAKVTNKRKRQPRDTTLHLDSDNDDGSNSRKKS